jgi:hypothetical protein
MTDRGTVDGIGCIPDVRSILHGRTRGLHQSDLDLIFLVKVSLV